MKKTFLIVGIASLLLASCDKIYQPVTPSGPTGEDLYQKYAGMDSATYWAMVGPVFGANPNTERNVLIEDFTGHKCPSCPIAAQIAEDIHSNNPDRVFVAAIHTGPSGIGPFQNVDVAGGFPIDWTNPDGLDIGIHFGSMTSSQFLGNPSGTVNRIALNGQHTQSPTLWENSANMALQEALKVNIQSEANYFESTKGMFLHTEIDVLDPSIMEDLYTVVYLIEDSIIGPQRFQGFDSSTYIHREVMRDCIQSGWQGKHLTAANEVAPNKYRFDYIFELPTQYDAENMHLLIYVRNAATDEIYHVVKQKFID